MFAASKTSTSALVDPQFNYVTMLLHGDGTNGAQNNTFVDSSTNNFTITRNGNTTQGSFSPYGSNWGNYFDGTGDYLSAAYNSAFAFTGDFTVEFWVNFSAHGSYGGLICCGSSSITWSGWNIIFNSSTDNLLVELNNSAISIVSSSALVKNVWNHVALVRSGTSIVLYINGVSNATATYGNTLDSVSAPLVIGVERTIAAYTTGYISNVRVVKGTAVYTGAFTPPTAPLTAITNTSLLTCQSNRFIDNSANNFTITKNGDVSVQRFNPFGASTAYSTSVIGGSAYFDGSGDYLTAPSNAAFGFPADFTVELFVYPTSTVNSITMYHGSVFDSLILYTSGTGNVIVRAFASGDVLTSATSLTLNTWNHVAIARSGSTLSMWINGSRANGGTVSNSTSWSTTALYIGSSNSGTQLLTGYISDVRVVKGTAVYNPSSTTITVPTAPLTAITNTSLLLNYTNGAIFDNAMMNDLETVGNAQISTSVKKYGTGSLAFDGTGDYLRGVNNPNFNLGSGNFTVEFWMYQTAATDGTNRYLTGVYDDTVGGSSFVAISYFGRVDSVVYFNDGTYLSLSSGTQSISQNTWYHIALVRNASTFSVYVNGLLSSSGTSTKTLNNPTATSFTVGSSSVGSYPFTGYIDDLRITKGYARYTANFTAPTAPFSNTGPI